MYALTLETIRDLPPERFLEDITRQRIKLFMDETEAATDWGDARSLLDILEVKYPFLLDPLRTPPVIVQELRELWARAVFFSFPNVNDTDLERMVRENILDVFSHHPDPRLVLDEQLAQNGYAVGLSVRLSVIAKALEYNTQRLGEKEIVRSDGRTLPPTVQGWIRDYRSVFARNVQRGAVEQATYLTKNKTASQLDAPSRQMLTKVIQFLDYLYFPTFQVRRESALTKRMEWEATKLHTTLADIALDMQRALLELKNPKGRWAKNPPPPAPTQKPMPTAPAAKTVIPVAPPPAPRPPVIPPKPVQAPAPPRAPSAPALETPMPKPAPISREEYWRQYLLGNPKQRLEMIRGLGSTTPMETNDVVPFIRACVLAGEIQSLVAKEQWTRKGLMARLKTLYQETAGLSRSDSAKEAVHVGNLLKQQGRPEFLDMAYFDMESKSFQWNDET